VSVGPSFTWSARGKRPSETSLFCPLDVKGSKKSESAMILLMIWTTKSLEVRWNNEHREISCPAS
jgi:hypothetical protein